MLAFKGRESSRVPDFNVAFVFLRVSVCGETVRDKSG